MKKLFLSLAALMMMTAPVMTSCSNDLDEVEVAPAEEQGDVVTITLKVEQQPETRVTIDESNPKSIKLTGWKEGDKVMLYRYKNGGAHSSYNRTIEGLGAEFKCVNALTGTFSGTVNSEHTLSEYTLVVYGGKAVVYKPSENSSLVYLEPNKYVSDKIEDLIVLAGFFNGTSATLKTINNIIKINNASGSEVETAWDYRFTQKLTESELKEDYYFNPSCIIDYDDSFGYTTPGISDYADVKKHTLANGLNYLIMGPMPMPAIKIGLVNSEGGFVIPHKSHDRDVVGKLYDAGTYTKSTSGLAMAKDIKEPWVQLWENGPKFAEHNVGALNASDQGTKMTFTDATAAGDGYVWGDNWRTPSQSEMDELYKATTTGKSTKVTCTYTQENGVWGFKFTGSETGYTKNSVFFPASDSSNGSNGAAQYWSAGTSGSVDAWLMSLRKVNGGWSSDWTAYPQNQGYFVRPVLK